MRRGQTCTAEEGGIILMPQAPTTPRPSFHGFSKQLKFRLSKSYFHTVIETSPCIAGFGIIMSRPEDVL